MEASPTDLVDILVVDDQPANILAMTAMLEQPGYNFVTASSGAAALRHVLQRAFAVILLDVVMPGMDGLEVASLIKSRTQSSGIPIIFLTAGGADIERVHQAYSLGAVDYLVKPVHPSVLRAKVGVFVELYRRTEEVRQKSELLRELDRRDRERQLDEIKSANERRYRDLAESIPQLVWRAEADGRVTYFTRRFREYSGMSEAETDGLGWLDAIHPDDRDEFRSRWLASVGSDSNFQAECRVTRGADGESRWHLCQALPEIDPSGAVLGWLGTFTDIDAQRRADEDRARLLRVAEAALEVRDDFLSIASHELRTPVTSLSLQIQSLGRSMRGEAREPLSSAGALRQIELAERQIARLTSLIGTLFDVSRISSGQVVLNLGAVDLCQIARDVGARYAGPCAEEGSDFEIDVRGPAIGRWDPLRIEQVVDNLLANALKYGAGMPIGVQVAVEGGAATLVVVDHGIGIAPEHQHRIFQRFERAVSPVSYGGLGLGLYITKSLVLAHGGAIDVKSAPGEGASFRVTLPIGP